MQVSPSYLIGDGGFLLGPIRRSLPYAHDLDMIVCQQELGPRRSEITYDRRKNFDNERCHDPHINRNQINVRNVSWIRKTGDFIPDAPRADGWCSDADNEIDFRFPVAGAPSRGGGIEQCSIPQPRDEMHSYSPSTQALLRMLLLLLLPRHAMSQRDANTLEGVTANYRRAIRRVLPLILACRLGGKETCRAVLFRLRS